MFKDTEIQQILLAGVDVPISNGSVVSKERPMMKMSDKDLLSYSKNAIKMSMTLAKMEPTLMKAIFQQSTEVSLTESINELASRQ